MQFTVNHKIGDNFINVEFKTDIVTLQLLNMESLKQTFQRVGGIFQDDYTFNFPLYITSQVISEIIHNTCFICGGLMQDSTALQNSLVSFDDFGNDAGKPGSTQSFSGPAKQITVRKCSQCGHSHT